MNFPDISIARIKPELWWEIDSFFQRLIDINSNISSVSMREYVKSFIKDSYWDEVILLQIADHLKYIRFNNLVDIANVLMLFSDYRSVPFLHSWFQDIAEKIFNFDIDKLNFVNLQKIISTFELLDIDVPAEIQNAFNRVLNDDSVMKYSIWPGEQLIVDDIIHNSWLDNFSVWRNEFIFWFEIDIIIYDTNWNIFAIIESDWFQHWGSWKTKADSARDQLIYRRWITDLIIRKTQRGCRIVERI